MTSKHLIKLASPSDEKPIKETLKACQLPYEDISPACLEHFFVAYQGRELIGTIGMEIFNTSGLLRSLAVAESHRGQGLGVKLTSEIEVYARSRRIQALYLLTTTADQFFSKLGYLVTDRTRVPISIQATEEFKSICPASAACMMKRI